MVPYFNFTDHTYPGYFPMTNISFAIKKNICTTSNFPSDLAALPNLKYTLR